mgnify:CR=1 FL=1
MHDRDKTRRGMTMIEIIAAAAILGVMLASAVQVIRVLETQRRTADRRALALETTQSLLEQLGNTPWDQLTPSANAALTIPEAVSVYLPSAKAVATVVEQQDPVPSKRIAVELQWNAPSGLPVAPIRLTTWVFENE